MDTVKQSLLGIAGSLLLSGCLTNEAIVHVPEQGDNGDEQVMLYEWQTPGVDGPQLEVRDPDAGLQRLVLIDNSPSDSGLAANPCAVGSFGLLPSAAESEQRFAHRVT